MRPFERKDEPIEHLIDLTERPDTRSLRDAVLLAIDQSGYVVDWQIDGEVAIGAPDDDLADLVG